MDANESTAPSIAAAELESISKVPSEKPDDTTSLQSNMMNDALAELERMRSLPAHEGLRFPTACLALLTSQSPENNACIDCKSPDPEWASVLYGCLLCNKCSTKHRSLGSRSIVLRHLTVDTWSYTQVLTMLEGGNSKLLRDFETHRLTKKEDCLGRYRTKIAHSYRTKLSKHVHAKIVESFPGGGKRLSLSKPTRSSFSVGDMRSRSSSENDD